MPIYEYRCAACGHELETLQRFSDAPLTDCPACLKAELRKRVSVAGFQLKGSGWYVTDFRNSGAKPAAKDAPAKTDANGNGEAKSTEAKSGDAKAGESAPAPAAAPSSDSTSTAKPAAAASEKTGA
jgi:putative FmdB family regulatory protein